MNATVGRTERVVRGQRRRGVGTGEMYSSAVIGYNVAGAVECRRNKSECCPGSNVCTRRLHAEMVGRDYAQSDILGVAQIDERISIEELGGFDNLHRIDSHSSSRTRVDGHVDI